MVTSSLNETIQSFRIEKELFIAAPLDITFEATLEELGPENTLPDGTPLPMVLEAMPGGRWYRDLGDNAGHLWGHVQVIKPAKILEICGPLFMSYPCVNHVQYRFAADAMGTKLSFLHRGFAELPDNLHHLMDIGWHHILEQIKNAAESHST